MEGKLEYTCICNAIGAHSPICKYYNKGKMEERGQLYNWGEEICREHGFIHLRRNCTKCWESLKQ